MCFPSMLVIRCTQTRPGKRGHGVEGPCSRRWKLTADTITFGQGSEIKLMLGCNTASTLHTFELVENLHANWGLFEEAFSEGDYD
jgi:hypothetical protein